MQRWLSAPAVALFGLSLGWPGLQTHEWVQHVFCFLLQEGMGAMPLQICPRETRQNTFYIDMPTTLDLIKPS